MIEKIIHKLRSIRRENFESSAENGVDSFLTKFLTNWKYETELI